MDEGCGAGSLAGAVIGTFFTTVLLIAVSALFYRRWRRNKGRHLVLVTDPEIVEDAYAFDNPCFKDATPSQNRNMERPLSVSFGETSAKDTGRWSSPFSLLAPGASNKSDKRRTLEDSIPGSRSTTLSVVSLKSADFVGHGFIVCGNMREGIFVKDLRHHSPASESGQIHLGDRITSAKIDFRRMTYEDAEKILDRAAPYDVEIEIERGGTGSRPSTLLKKTIGLKEAINSHPLYRSNSIPELSSAQKDSAKRLFSADPNESSNSNYSVINSTLESSKLTAGSHNFDEPHEEAKMNNHHHKFGIKVLPALDGTVHRVVDQNEHNTNLERRNSRKMDSDKSTENEKNSTVTEVTTNVSGKITERLRQRENSFPKIGKMENDEPGIRVSSVKTEEVVILSDVPEEVHNAAMAARRNRKSSAELLDLPKGLDAPDFEDTKSPQKNKRKAPAPPGSPTKDEGKKEPGTEDSIESITDYTESLNEYVGKVRDASDDSENRRNRRDDRSSGRRNSESDTDSEVQHSFTTIELNPADITIHHTPVPRVGEEDDVYRKAASLGDLSKYEAKSLATLERAQSLDMADTGSKKRKAPMPPEDITESTEDLTKLDDMDTFDRRKLKKSSEWGTLEDAIWKRTDDAEAEKPRIRKKSNGTLERSKSAVEMKIKEEETSSGVAKDTLPSSDDCSVELFNLPLSKRLTKEFIHAERMFNPDEDNSLARIVNNGEIVKSATPEEIELDFRQAKPLSDDEEEEIKKEVTFGKAVKLFDLYTKPLDKEKIKKDLDFVNGNDENIYAGKKEVQEEPMRKVIISTKCPGCEENGHHNKYCALHSRKNGGVASDSVKLENKISEPEYFQEIEKQIEKSSKKEVEEEEVDDGCDLGSSVTVNSKSVSSLTGDHYNVSNVSVSSGENSEDSGLVGESGEFNQETRSPSSDTLAPNNESPKKMTYITEIKVSPTVREESAESIPKPPRSEVTVTSNGKMMPGKKPPVPPRRNDSSKSQFKESSGDKQVVYVSEIKSQEKNLIDSPETLDKQPVNKKFEHWIFVGENKEQNPWGNGSSQPQPITNIVVSSGDEKQS